MDRIRKAVDLAREERARALEPVGDEQRSADLRPANSLPARIEYTKTRTFEPSAALLETNRIISPGDSTSAAAAFRMLRTQVL